MEIASLTEHLLTECERRADFTQCPLCSEALTRDKLTEHAQSTACNRESFVWMHSVFTSYSRNHTQCFYKCHQGPKLTFGRWIDVIPINISYWPWNCILEGFYRERYFVPMTVLFICCTVQLIESVATSNTTSNTSSHVKHRLCFIFLIFSFWQLILHVSWHGLLKKKLIPLTNWQVTAPYLLAEGDFS